MGARFLEGSLGGWSTILKVVCIFSMLASIGCATEADAPPPMVDSSPMGGSGPSEFPDAPDETCEEDAQEECSVIIHQANGQKSCFTGVKFCVDGAWSACLES